MWRGKDRLIRVIICKVFMDGKKIRNNRFLENKSSGSLFISKNNNGKAIKPDHETAKGTLYYDEKKGGRQGVNMEWLLLKQNPDHDVK